MAVTPAFIDELRNRLNLSDLVGRRVKLVPKGGRLAGLCPFHNEKTPSFYVNDPEGFYHCFGCGANGDMISYHHIAMRCLMSLDAINRKNSLT